MYTVINIARGYSHRGFWESHFARGDSVILSSWRTHTTVSVEIGFRGAGCKRYWRKYLARVRPTCISTQILYQHLSCNQQSLHCNISVTKGGYIKQCVHLWILWVKRFREFCSLKIQMYYTHYTMLTPWYILKYF